VSRYDSTDFEWRVIKPLLPDKPRRVPRVDDRRVPNGIFWCCDPGSRCQPNSGSDPQVEWALRAGQDQAADLTMSRAC